MGGSSGWVAYIDQQAQVCLSVSIGTAMVGGVGWIFVFAVRTVHAYQISLPYLHLLTCTQPLSQRFDNPSRRPFERLLRSVLNLPRRPAVVLVAAYSHMERRGRFWDSAEAAHFTFAQYYDLPLLSLRSAVIEAMVENRKGFQVRSVIWIQSCHCASHMWLIV